MANMQALRETLERVIATVKLPDTPYEFSKIHWPARNICSRCAPVMVYAKCIIRDSQGQPVRLPSHECVQTLAPDRGRSTCDRCRQLNHSCDGDFWSLTELLWMCFRLIKNETRPRFEPVVQPAWQPITPETMAEIQGAIARADEEIARMNEDDDEVVVVATPVQTTLARPARRRGGGR